MQAFGNPARMQLLSILRTPHSLGEIHLAPNRQDAVASPSRNMNRVSVRHHLEQLIAIGAVRQFDGIRDGRTTSLYQINHRQLFALSEELRELGRIRPDADFIVDGTAPGPAAAGRTPTGPRLILMNGAYEGRAFPLTAPGERTWTIGRRRDGDIVLEYDPFLSLDNSQIQLQNGMFTLHDVAGNRNGTRINWNELPRGGQTPLRPGDVIGVGRSQLLFRTE